MTPSYTFKFLISIIFFILQIGLFGQNDTIKAEELYYDGKDLYYQGNYEAAITKLTEALSLRSQFHDRLSDKVMKANYRLAKAKFKGGYYDEALIYMKEAIDIAEKVEGYISKKHAYYILDLANIYDKTRDLEKGELTLKKGRKILERTGASPVEIASIYMNLANLYIKFGRFRDAGKYYQQTESIYNEHLPPNDILFNKLYLNQCSYFRRVFEPKKAIEYGEKALKIKLLNYKKSHPSVPKYYKSLADAYYADHRFNKADEYSREAHNLCLENNPPEHPNIASSYIDMGGFYVDINQKDKALINYKKGLRLFKKRLAPDHPKIGIALSNIGNVFFKQELYDSAFHYFNLAFEIHDPEDKRHHYNYLYTARKFAEALSAKEQHSEAIQYIEKVIYQLNPNINFDHFNQKDLNNLYEIQDDRDFLDLMNSRSEFYFERYKKSDLEDDLLQAFNGMDYAIQFIDAVKKKKLNENSKLYLNRKISKFYANGVKFAFELYQVKKEETYLQEAIQFSEKSKASVLWQNINEQHAFKKAVPKKILKAFNELKENLMQVNHQIHENKQPELIDSLETSRLKLGHQLEQMLLEIEDTYPEFYKLKYASAEIDFEKMQKRIASKTLVVEYFYDSHDVYIFTISNDNIEGMKIPYDKKEVFMAIKRLREGSLDENIISIQAKNDFVNDLNGLYTLFIEPIASQIQKFDKLLFIPHGILQYISYESLCPTSQDKDFRNMDYLLKHHRISYAWSIALWQNRPNKKRKGTHKFIGFAPTFDSAISTDNSFLNNRSELSKLDYTTVEIEYANSHYFGEVYLEGNATAENFLEQAPKSEIIHLATHGLIDDYNPMESGIAFSRTSEPDGVDFITAATIYEMDLNADLAVISACNTGYGKLEQGEGVMSLGRAFLHSGCKSILMSLWLANDISTSEIVSNFYAYSKNGADKDEALQLAKLEYLKNSDGITAHPYFWANMIAVGDMSPLESKASLKWWMLALGLGICLSGYGVYRIS